ncbi:hypothetical protein RvY_11293 [Ramazzottius varieornatus]|uniref:Uncharacterized protein n=1 Tax=Ramazzottius varieornatus TaxID=947166 RepID=A0A1D1VI21_RAMVA|nr:hypothetical protein RvY_11293 [Ramazzottius varieornatus]
MLWSLRCSCNSHPTTTYQMTSPAREIAYNLPENMSDRVRPHGAARSCAVSPETIETITCLQHNDFSHYYEDSSIKTRSKAEWTPPPQWRLRYQTSPSNLSPNVF